MGGDSACVGASSSASRGAMDCGSLVIPYPERQHHRPAHRIDPEPGDEDARNELHWPNARAS
jgi:hypothetical protein